MRLFDLSLFGYLFGLATCLNTTLTANGITLALALDSDSATATPATSVTSISTSIEQSAGGSSATATGGTNAITSSPSLIDGTIISPSSTSDSSISASLTQGSETVGSCAFGVPILWNATTHIVHVGANSTLAFAPNHLMASIGDTIVFVFHSTNHSLSESSLQTPCKHQQGGFTSGFHQLNPNSNNETIVAFSVNSLEPRFFFCEQTINVPHCSYGMVFALNPGDSLNAFFGTVIESGSLKDVAGLTSAQTITTSLTVDGSMISATSTVTSVNMPIASAAIETVSLPVVRPVESLGSRQAGPDLISRWPRSKLQIGPESAASSIAAILMKPSLKVVGVVVSSGLLLWLW